MAKRIDGLDAARAVALFGMMIENFNVVSALGMTNPQWRNLLMGSLDGRSAPLFVILAGMGLSLMTLKARKSGDPFNSIPAISLPLVSSLISRSSSYRSIS